MKVVQNQMEKRMEHEMETLMTLADIGVEG